MSPQTIVFVRHAHRHKDDPSEDSGLSEKGIAQVRELLLAFKGGQLPVSETFWSSPKKRCTETIEPLAEAALSEMTIENLLDEQGPKESTREFIQRIDTLVAKISGQTERVLYLCSHGDVIPEAINALTGAQVDVKKGRATIIVKKNNRWEVR